MKPILVIMGSDSDLKYVSAGLQVLKDFGVGFDVRISSAHRTLSRTLEIITNFEDQGGQVIIAAAGMSAHLAGVIAAHTVLPVLGLPLSSPDFGGLDSLLSMIEMPPGIPVGVMGKGKSGAKNAALLSLQILALKDESVRLKLLEFRKNQAKGVIQKDEQLGATGWENYEK